MTYRPKWLDIAFAIERKHIEFIKVNKIHTISDTAIKVGRSAGTVTEDLMIAKFSRAYEDEIMKSSSRADALRFIRDKKHELKLKEFNIMDG